MSFVMGSLTDYFPVAGETAGSEARQLRPSGGRGNPFFGRLLVVCFPLVGNAAAALEPEMHPLLRNAE